ncbi:hypothetical protein Taro_016124 [Colocasia esculenta]|uniref:Uncharacterized protein n=1 Tax=Colocasia esculenta TaxID=4460 RepID=A0A843UD44_COLES|nr:hypothetical protein [Colocasia esculenta]
MGPLPSLHCRGDGILCRLNNGVTGPFAVWYSPKRRGPGIVWYSPGWRSLVLSCTHRGDGAWCCLVLTGVAKSGAVLYPSR